MSASGPSAAAAPGPPRLVRDGGPYTAILTSRAAGADLDAARSTARSRSATRPLAGITVAVKDLVAVAGQPLGAGSAVRADAAPEPADAPIVARLRACGATIVGLVTLHEFAFGVTGLNAWAGTPENPRAAGCIPGGSSSGSAVAVADGSARVAIGTDTGGSVRIPAALCGVAGFKPSGSTTYPTTGVFPLAPSLDTVGTLASTVADLAAVHAALGELPGPPVRPARVGVVRAALDDAEPAVAIAVESVLAALVRAGCELVDVSWPGGERVLEVSTTIMFAEAAATHRRGLEERSDLYGADVRERLARGEAILRSEREAADRERTRLAREARALLSTCDCVVEPTVGVLPPTAEAAAAPEVVSRLVASTRLANVARLPAASIPVGGDGPPVGLHVTAASDVATLAAAAWIEWLLDAA
ncbi:amidase [Conexibacter woesei]|uniref:Amidase n=1 Tax=Conexibacter woesei (strain DSM 14684 / CCUG 47730 / CIP 108061 / JCM 11494 / NBRC 100937 / ID131577) TaxID=469383 RepID=D3F6Y3_CONWI|nr:amidase [Conexibacter woesei]ADB52781.1 Amidase [Conexibacter woesei DSM 14684]